MAAGGSTAEAMQPEMAEEVGLNGEVVRAGAEEAELPAVHHKSWETERPRALNGVRGAELQPE